MTPDPKYFIRAQNELVNDDSPLKMGRWNA